MKLTNEQFKALKKRYVKAKAHRDGDYTSHMKDIANFVLPEHGRFIDSRDSVAARGGNKRRHIIDPAATYAATIAAAGMKGGLVPHSLPWFKLGLQDEDLARWEPARQWLAEVQRRMYALYSRSNFYPSAHTVFHEQVLFGTGPIQADYDMKYGAWFKPWTVGEYTLMQDQHGRISCGFRTFYETLRNLADQFGKESLSTASRGTFEHSPDTYVVVVKAIFPRKDYDPSKADTVNMPYASVYWEDKSTDIDPPLGESGYRSAPVMYPRWDVIGEGPYGTTCPGIVTLPDVKMLQKMQRDALAAIDKVVDPPMMVPDSFMGRLSLLPGAQNKVKASHAEQVKSIYEGSPDLNAIEAKLEQTRDSIRRGYFNDLFILLANEDKQMTAFEVARRFEEKLSILGPVIERQNSEFLAPLIDRTYDIMESSEAIPPPPEELEGIELKVEYISLLAQAQKAVGTQAIEQVASFAGGLAELNPEILDKLDMDEMIEQYGDMKGVAPKVVRSKDQVDKIRKERQAQAQAAQELEAAQSAAATGKTLADTNISEDNALSSVLSGMGTPQE